MLVLQILVALVVTVAAGWELQRLRRSPRDPGLRVLVPGLVLLAFSLIAGIHVWPLTLVDRFQDATWIGSVIWLVMAWCYAAFFVMADTATPIEARRRRARISFFCLVALVIVSYACVITVGSASAPSTMTAVVSRIANATIYLGALVFYAIGSYRASSYLRELSSRWLRAAVGLVIVGAGAMTIGVDVVTVILHVIFRVGVNREVDAWLKVVYNVGRIGGQILLALGLGLAPLATLVIRAQRARDRRAQRHAQRALRPLWRRLTEEFPFLVLESSTSNPAIGRMLTEITDALGHLSAFVPDAGHTTPASAHDAADLVAAALDARRAARASTGDAEHARAEPPYPPIEPDFGSDWHAQVGWMQTVATDLDSRGYLATASSGPAPKMTAG